MVANNPFPKAVQNARCGPATTGNSEKLTELLWKNPNKTITANGISLTTKATDVTQPPNFALMQLTNNNESAVMIATGTIHVCERLNKFVNWVPNAIAMAATLAGK